MQGDQVLDLSQETSTRALDQRVRTLSPFAFRLTPCLIAWPLVHVVLKLPVPSPRRPPEKTGGFGGTGKRPSILRRASHSRIFCLTYGVLAPLITSDPTNTSTTCTTNFFLRASIFRRWYQRINHTNMTGRSTVAHGPYLKLQCWSLRSSMAGTAV